MNDETLQSVERLSRDLAAAAVTLSRDEARFLVDAYYMMQAQRIRADAQVRALNQSQEPHAVLSWLGTQSNTLETQVKRALGKYADTSALGQWAMSIKGIGPVIASGLLANIDIAMCPTVGHIWSFAGLNPTQRWERGEKRPWNASLKVLQWKIGESFVMVSGDEESFYGQVYLRRKQVEIERNTAGAFKDQAAEALKRKNFKKDTQARKHYESGHLPPAHIHARAKRYAVKLFLSAYHEVGFFLLHGKLPPLPYPLAHLGHAHYIGPPNAELIPGLVEARRQHAVI